MKEKGGLGYLAKKHGVSSKNRYTDGSMLIVNLEKNGSCVSEKAKLFFSIQDRCDRVISNE